ncbi:TetR/AcrR family transcriptional regulator [Streptomyces hoynatensis]|uniref:TetR family transcriptional regulator n=1 Tax=Streptomyces hoynatensis TaxID=1141874 RepID=A0A3A9YLE3_9ACTN|nr:TetR family transcriptional regulator [Streptomyces hoynatensis]RKN37181.1 TetR family transcriptional regulator [Streptomyces hoynatensis]
MTDTPGLRERKKQRTRTAISEAAIALFLDRGFDRVSVAEIAEAAEVSKRTLFAYFPAKEDLVVHRFADHETEAARVVRARPPGTAPLDALRAHFLDALGRRDPFTGLNDSPAVRDLYRMLLATPALVARLGRFRTAAERGLAEALCETADASPLPARLAAAQLVAVHWVLTLDNAEALTAGQSADARHPAAREAAERAFALLARGLGDLS